MPISPVGLRDYLIQNIDDEKCRGTRFKWCLKQGGVYSYGWCTKSKNPTTFTFDMHEAKHINFFSFSLDTIDTLSSTYVNVEIDSPFSIIEKNNECSKCDIFLETLGTINPFSKKETRKLSAINLENHDGSSVSIYAKGKIKYIGDKGQSIDDRFDLQSGY